MIEWNERQMKELIRKMGLKQVPGQVYVGHGIRLDQILKEHAEWKEQQGRLLAENSPADPTYGPDWGR